VLTHEDIAMNKRKIPIRLSEKAYLKIKELADHSGQSATAFMRNTLLERLEDESDYREALKSIEQSEDDIISSDAIMKYLGI
jgi:RHH-type rel operon transcriptional repressor/antitoxin RelB